MTGLDLLMRAEALRREIERREERIGTLRRLAEAVGRSFPEGPRVLSSPDPGRIQRLLDEAADEEEAVRLLYGERAAVLTDLALLFSFLPDALSAGVMQLRYLEGLPWQEVFRRAHLSRSRAFALHRAALEFLGTLEGNSCIDRPCRGILSEDTDMK